MSLLLIFISSLLLAALGLLGISVLRKELSPAWLIFSLLLILLFLPLGIFLPGLSWNVSEVNLINQQNYHLPWERILGGLWLCGALIGFIKLYNGMKAYRLWSQSSTEIKDPDMLLLLKEVCDRAGLENPPALCVSENLSSPVLGGLNNPTLFLPPNYDHCSDETIKMVFWHEIGHIVRRDLWKQVLGHFTQVIYWFNPFVSKLQKVLSHQSELACDAWVMKKVISRKTYLNALCDVAESISSKQSIPYSLSMADHISLADRVKILVNDPIKKNPLLVGLFLLVLVTVGFGIVSLKTVGNQVSPDEINLRLTANPFPAE